MRRRQFKNNSIDSALRLPTITLLLFGCVFLLGTSSAFAVTMEIQFTGVNLSYDPNTISDAESPAGGTGDPNDADPLDSIQFKVGGDLQGTAFTDDIAAEEKIIYGGQLYLPAVPATQKAFTASIAAASSGDLKVYLEWGEPQ